jgi:ferredoxin
MTISETGQPVAADARPSLSDGASLIGSSQSHQIAVPGLAQSVKCHPGASVLDAFEHARQPLTSGDAALVQVGCRRGGCGVCKVRVIEGSYRATPMSRAHISEDDQAEGLVLACCVYPETDLTVSSVPQSPKNQKNN